MECDGCKEEVMITTFLKGKLYCDKCMEGRESFDGTDGHHFGKNRPNIPKYTNPID